MLKLDNVSKGFYGPDGRVDAIVDATLCVEKGDLVAIRGTSGCGKSTLLLTAGTLLRPDAGKVWLDGEDVYARNPNERTALRAASIGFVFQQFHLIPYLSVLENVLTPCAAKPRPDSVERARALIEQFGISHRINHVPEQLSTGERQRTALARALLNEPKLILADEPTGNLDEENGRAVLSYLAEFARAGGAVLIVSHDSKIADFATRTARMDVGRLDLAGQIQRPVK